MPVCKFFLTNSCRYGDSCRFEHPHPSQSQDRYSYVNKNSPAAYRDDRYVYVNKDSPSVQRGEEYGYVTNQGDERILVKQYTEQMFSEVSAIENCNQWPLTCMGFVKAFSIPGWIDYSVEEIRLKAYQAMASGTFSNYVLEFQTLLNNAKELRSVFYRPGKEGEHIIREGIKAARDGSIEQQSNAFFKQPQAQQTFASSQAKQSIFGGNQAFNQNLFGLSNDPAPGLFSNVIAPPNQSSQAFNQPMFAEVANQQRQSTNSFGSSNMFQNPIPQVNLQNSTVFGSVPIANQQNASAFGSSPLTIQQQKLIYSNMSDLTEEEIKQFRDPTFSEDQIPLKPPPVEFCNF